MLSAVAEATEILGGDKAYVEKLRRVSEFTCAIASLRMLLMCSSNDGVRSSQTTE